jgi:hypothetical protein
MNIAPARPAPKKLTVLVDTREQTPITFPSNLTYMPGYAPIPVTCKRATLDAGDYTLAEHPELFGVERKGCLAELVHNFSRADWPRQRRSLSRLCSMYRYPYLLVEATVTELTQEPCYPYLGVLLGQLPTLYPSLRLMLVGRQRSIGRRISLGEFILQFFLGHLLVGDLTNAESVV